MPTDQYGNYRTTMADNGVSNPDLSGGGSGSTTSGTGAPSAAPTGDSALYIQTDSVPPGQLWEYYDGAWH